MATHATVTITAIYTEDGEEVRKTEDFDGDAPLPVRFEAEVEDIEAGWTLEWRFTHEGAEGYADVHQRECDGQAGDGIGTDIGNMPDVDAVDHVVQRSRRLGDDTRDGELPQQCANFFGAEFKRRCTGVCHLQSGIIHQFYVESERRITGNRISGAVVTVTKGGDE